MTLSIRVDLEGIEPDEIDRAQIDGILRTLERRLVARPEPHATVVLARHARQRRIDADLRIELGPLGPTLISHQNAANADLAVRRAVKDVDRELEHQVARQRGEDSYGVPSRRQPRRLRPHPLPGKGGEAAGGPGEI